MECHTRGVLSEIGVHTNCSMSVVLNFDDQERPEILLQRAIACVKRVIE